MPPWTKEQEELRAVIEDLGDALSDGHATRDQLETFPAEQWKLLAGTGLFGLPIEEPYGGLGQDLLTTMFVLEGLGYSCRDAGLSFSASAQIVSAGVPLQRFGHEELKKRHLPRIASGEAITAHAITEPESGSDALSMRTTARQDGDSYVLDGSKTFVTNGPVADLITVYAKTGAASGVGAITAILVERDTPGLTIGHKISKMGLRTSPFCELHFDGCRVPASNVIGRPGSGFWVFDYVMKREILCSFVINIGEMQHRLERTIEYARTRRQAAGPISSHQAVSHRIVDMKVRLETARLWLYETARKVQLGRDTTIDVAVGKLLASTANVDSASAALQIHGGYGYTTEYGIEQQLRDAIPSLIYSGTSDIQKNRIATMLGL
ncbi:acyl-CoA dehydrogenase family protein [Streptomyces hyaluromycini]|uniref:Acyl-CoA dehydrogenase family protein n=1 Tax=Streptomyces hyaluromycini TaxID=1377993 RepID=A0ABV1WRE3_9ACTN